MPDEHRVPEVLLFVRKLRRSRPRQPISPEKLGPSSLYAKCAQETSDEGGMVHRGLYIHAFVEAGWIGAKPEPNYEPFMVCPICGFVF